MITKKEQEFLRLLLLQDRKIKKLFSETINQVSGHLNQFAPVDRALIANDIWVKNSRIEAKIEKALTDFQSQYTVLLTDAKAEAMGISKQYGDELVESYLKRLPVTAVVKEGISVRSLEAFNAFQKKGLAISGDVWKTTQAMKDQIAFYGASGIASGQSSKRISTDLNNYLQNPDKRFRRIRDKKTGKLKLSEPAKNFHPGQGVYRSSYQNALRMAQTETNMAFRHSDQARWSGMDFVNGYEVKLSGAHPADDICDHMAGKYPKSFLFGGWHPKCICYIVPIMSPTKDFVNYLKTGELNSNNVVTSIPKRAQDYVDKMASKYARYKSKPYFIKDNFTFSSGKYQLRKNVTSPKYATLAQFKNIPKEVYKKRAKEVLNYAKDNIIGKQIFKHREFGDGKMIFTRNSYTENLRYSADLFDDKVEILKNPIKHLKESTYDRFSSNVSEKKANLVLGYFVFKGKFKGKNVEYLIEKRITGEIIFHFIKFIK